MCVCVGDCVCVCECVIAHVKWLADYLQENPIETSGARCTSPRRLANKRIGQIKSKKFRCSGNTHTHTHTHTQTHTHTHSPRPNPGCCVCVADKVRVPRGEPRSEERRGGRE